MDADRDELSQSERLLRLRQAMYSRSLSPKIKPRDRRALHEENFGVPNDFQETEPGVSKSTIAPRFIGAGRTIAFWALGASILFFVAAVIAFLYFFIAGPGSLTAAPGNIDIIVRGPLTVESGTPTQLQVIVRNKNRANLQLADLIVHYPDGTRSPADFLTPLTDQRISLGTIESGGERQGTVSAVFLAEKDAHKDVRVELEYRVEDSNAIFVADTTYILAFASAPVSITTEANDEAISGQRVLITTTVRADSTTPLRDVVVEAAYPFGFTIEETDPKVSEGTLWELSDMQPGETRTITVRGTLEGQEQDERVFRFVAGIRGDKDEKYVSVPLSEATHHMVLARPFIGLSMAINKEIGVDTVSVAAGDIVNVNIEYVNNLAVPIENIVLVARFTGVDIPGANIQSNDGFYRSADKTVLFDRSTTRGALSQVRPGERGTVGFAVTLPEAIELTAIREGKLDITVHAAGKRVGESNVPETLQSTLTKSVKLASDTRLIAQGFYYQNPFGSVGPLPPKVNNETTYAIVLTLANTANTIQQGKVTAQLPPYVRWVGVYSPAQERVTFGARDGTMTWDVGTLNPGVGVDGAVPRQIAFALGFTPSASQIGQQPALINDMVFTGRDSFTGQDIQLSVDDVTSNLFDDPGFSTTEASVVAE